MSRQASQRAAVEELLHACKKYNTTPEDVIDRFLHEYTEGNDWWRFKFTQLQASHATTQLPVGWLRQFKWAQKIINGHDLAYWVGHGIIIALVVAVFLLLIF